MTDPIGKHYAGALAEEYFAWQGSVGEIGARLNRFKFEHYIRQHQTVIDFGCGNGALLAGFDVARRIGVEPAPPARAAAWREGLEMYATASEVPTSIADVVISNHALEHSIRPADELRELHRVLRPNGTLVLWLPLDDWRSQRDPRSTDPNHHLYTWTPLLLANLLEEAGFRIGTVRIVRHAWPPGVAQLQRLPSRLFDALAFFSSVILRRRQISAIAYRD